MRGAYTGHRSKGRAVASPHVISLDGATVLLQWAVGGLFWLWVTTRRREVGLGYGWLLRGVFLRPGHRLRSRSGLARHPVPVREASAVGRGRG